MIDLYVEIPIHQMGYFIFIDEKVRHIAQKFYVDSSNGMWAYSSKIRHLHIAQFLQIYQKIVTFLPVPHEYFEDNGRKYFWNNVSNSFSSLIISNAIRWIGFSKDKYFSFSFYCNTSSSFLSKVVLLFTASLKPPMRRTVKQMQIPGA